MKFETLCCFSANATSDSLDDSSDTESPTHSTVLRNSNSFHGLTAVSRAPFSPHNNNNSRASLVPSVPSCFFDDVTVAGSPIRNIPPFIVQSTSSSSSAATPFASSNRTNTDRTAGVIRGQRPPHALCSSALATPLHGNVVSTTSIGNAPYQNLLMRNFLPQVFQRRGDDDNVLYSLLPSSRCHPPFQPHPTSSQPSRGFLSPFSPNSSAAAAPNNSHAHLRVCDCEHHPHSLCNHASSSARGLLYSNSVTPFRFPQHGDSMQPKIFTQREYIHFLIPDQENIIKSVFYWGKMDRHEAEQLLCGKPEGAFLLRDSVQDDFTFSISFRRYCRTLHARIEQHKHHFSLDSHDPNVYQSSTINGLLEHYKNPESSMFFEPLLTIPQKRKMPFSLKVLARAAVCDRVSYDAISLLDIPLQLKDYLREYNYKQVVSARRLDLNLTSSSSLYAHPTNLHHPSLPYGHGGNLLSVPFNYNPTNLSAGFNSSFSPSHRPFRPHQHLLPGGSFLNHRCASCSPQHQTVVPSFQQLSFPAATTNTD